MHKIKKKQVLAACVISATLLSAFPGEMLHVNAAESEDEVVLRVCNWEEYIDLGDWSEEETIDLPEGDIIGINPMYEDFEEWYYETYGQRVRVEYSCFGTNEELYNMLTLGDKYDIVCPSEYMIMKMMAEDMLVPFSEHFFDVSDENNDYIRRVSPFIRETFETNQINGEPWSKYAAGYMWGVTGILYNPDIVSEEEASTLNAMEGMCGDSLEWEISNSGVLTISGYGEMENYSSGNAPWYSERSNIKKIKIKEGVTTIGNYAFYY